MGKSIGMQSCLQPRIKKLAAFAQQTGHQAYFARLIGRHEEALYIARRRQRLVACQPLQKASRQAAIGEGHIGKASSCDLDLVGISHD